MSVKRVLIAGLYHETHTFTPGRTGLSDFTILRRSELWQTVGEPSPLGGAMETARACSWEVIPAIDYRAMPSGIVADGVLDLWWQEFEATASAALLDSPIQGVFLVLHGAMVTETCRDVEGEILERIRGLPGLAQTRLGGVTDLHANVSARMAQFDAALVTYRENPHTDAKIAAVRAAHVLDRLLETDLAVQTFRAQPPLVLAPTLTGTADEPMRTLEAMARRMETEHSHFLAINVHAGFAFADMHDTGVSFTILSVGECAEVGNCLAELCDAAMQIPVSSRTAEMPLEETMARLTEYASGPILPGPILLVEPSDNIGGGAPGEGVALLQALIAHDIQNAGVIVNDPEAVATLATLSPGDRRTLRFGGKSSPLYGVDCEIEIELVSRSDGRFALEDPRSHLASMVGWQVNMGPCAVVRHRGILILLTSRATPPFDLGQWRSQGVAPEQLFAIGVKAAVAHRQAYDPIAYATLYVDTPGPCRSDLRTLPFQHIRRPVRPLDAL